MRFQIGEQVVFLYESGGGVIRRIDNQVFFVEDETGFERPFRVTEIAKIHGTDYGIDDDAEIHVLDDDSTEELKHTVRHESRTGHLKPMDVWEVDLHIESLVDTHRGMSNTEILQKQMGIFKSFYERARQKNIRKLIVIHGVGEGVLKSEVRSYLQGRAGVEFFDAPYSEYGKGATQVEIRYNI